MPSDEEFVLPTSFLIWLSPGCVLPVSSAQLNHPKRQLWLWCTCQCTC